METGSFKRHLLADKLHVNRGFCFIKFSMHMCEGVLFTYLTGSAWIGVHENVDKKGNAYACVRDKTLPQPTTATITRSANHSNSQSLCHPTTFYLHLPTHTTHTRTLRVCECKSVREPRERKRLDLSVKSYTGSNNQNIRYIILVYPRLSMKNLSINAH